MTKKTNQTCGPRCPGSLDTTNLSLHAWTFFSISMHPPPTLKKKRRRRRSMGASFACPVIVYHRGDRKIKELFFLFKNQFLNSF